MGSGKNRDQVEADMRDKINSLMIQVEEYRTELNKSRDRVGTLSVELQAKNNELLAMGGRYVELQAKYNYLTTGADSYNPRTSSPDSCENHG